MDRYDCDHWRHACGRPRAAGTLRSRPSDFEVEEMPVFEPSGEGEHVCLWVEKTGCNTEWVAQSLARLAEVKSRDVSYAGLKDRHAVSRQWFSVHLVNRPEPDWRRLDSESVRVLDVRRHRRKIKRGALKGNRFHIRVRDFQGEASDLAGRIERCRQGGVPNYFGEQRFGRQGRNLERAQAMFAGQIRPRRHLRGLYLSAARAFLFNHVLSRRVGDDCWNRVLPGDVVMLAGSHSRFAAEPGGEADLQRRLDDGDLHVTGPLYGTGAAPVSAEAGEREAAVMREWPALAEGLIASGTQLDRRPLRLLPGDWRWSVEEDQLWLSFTLPAGSYATVVLRELLNYHDAGRDGV